MASRLSRWREVNRMVNSMLDNDEDSIESDEILENFSSNTMTQNQSDESLNADLPDRDLQTSKYVNESLSSSCDSLSEVDNLENYFSVSEDMAAWATVNCISQQSLTKLLKILNHHFPQCSLPSDGRTLLKTPRSVNIESKCGGEYLYFGLQKSISRKLSKIEHQNFVNINLIINIDGLPLYKSSTLQVWPILGSFSNSPFIIGLYCGLTKPNDEREFLKDLIEEYEVLKNNGIIFNGKVFPLKIIFFCCDTPARQLIKSIKGHTGYFSCERCCVAGGKVGGCTVFPDIDEELRSNDEFNLYMYDEHQSQKCSLADINFECVSGFVLDFMHLICLGVMKRMLMFISIGSRKCRLPCVSLNQISIKLESLKSVFPSEFNRKPRSLECLKRWKATEFKNFLLYTGIYCLKGIFSQKMYEHFLVLSVATSILLYYEHGNDSYADKINYAHNLFRWFVANSPEFYGDAFISLNVHNLIHIHQDVINHKMGLQEMSAFQFENHMQVIKKYVKNSRNPLAQIHNRVSELDEANSQYSSKPFKCKFAANEKDAWFSTNNHYCKILSENEKSFVCDTYKIKHTKSYFKTPCDSKILKIALLSNSVIKKRKTIQKTDIQSKIIAIQEENALLLIPINHSLKV